MARLELAVIRETFTEVSEQVGFQVELQEQPEVTEKLEDLEIKIGLGEGLEI